MTEKQEEKITLTLNSEAQAQEEVVEEVIPEAELVKIEDTKLTEEEKQMVDDFAAKIDIMETNTILQYGSAAQNKIADFSETALKNVRTKEYQKGLPCG
jgi:uncharacterized protein YaaN involved in tellurite resistance